MILEPFCYDDNMKLYLSSYRIPTPDDLAKLLSKPLKGTSVALIPNAKDYYSQRARDLKVGNLVTYMEELGLKVDIIDLREYSDPDTLKDKLASYDLVWSMGGNTYMLRYEMRRSGFDKIIRELLESGIVYGGDSAGALAAGQSIAGVESADEPEFAEELILEGLNLVPVVILPHVDNPEFANVLPIFRDTHKGKDIIELKDSEAVIFENDKRSVVESKLHSPL
jgi:dipeptidase E